MSASIHIPAAEPAVDLAAKPRNRWGAVLLSLATPGLGHVYAGRARRGLAFALGGAALLVAGMRLSMIVPHPALRLLLLVLAVASLPCTIVDAYRVAARSDRDFRLKWYNRWYVYLAIWIVSSFGVQQAVFHVIRSRIAQAFMMPNSSMEPGLLAGDHLYAEPIRGEITRGLPVVYQDAEGRSHIKRVAALPADTVEMRRKVLYINGQAQREAYVRHIDPGVEPHDPEMMWQQEFLASPQARYQPSRDNWGPLVIPPGRYFMLGDDRDNSFDSRYSGFVEGERIVRRPVWIYLSRDADLGGIRWGRIGRGIE